MQDFLAGIDRQLFFLAAALVCLPMLASAASADPCTLYKPEDIKRARENVKRYKWAQAIVALAGDPPLRKGMAVSARERALGLLPPPIGNAALSSSMGN